MKKQLLTPILLTLAGLFWAGMSPTFAESTDTLEKSKTSGFVTMGVRDSSGALSYTLGDGKYAGYHYEICQRIIANLEKAVGKKLETKYLSVTSQNRIPLVQNGTVDIECGSTTNNLARQKDVAFVVTTVSILDLLRSLTVDSFKSRRLVASSSSSLFLLCVDVVKGNRTTIHSTRLDSRYILRLLVG